MRNLIYIAAVFLRVLIFPSKSETAELERKTAWKGTVDISEKITVPAGGILTILPGTKVVFHKGGEIVCRNGTLDAVDAEFESDYRSENHFFSFESSNVKFKNCIFRNMYPGRARYSYDKNRSFFYALYGTFSMTGCSLEKCSAIELVWIEKSLIENNLFNDVYQRALTFRICRNVVLLRNIFEAGNESSELLFLNCVDDSSVILNRFYGNVRAISLKDKSKGNAVISNSMFNSSIGIHVQGQAKNNLFFGNLIFKPSSSGLNFISAGKNNIISNCVVWGAKNNGIYIGKTNDLIVRNSVFANCKYGINISNESEASVIEHNIIWNNNRDEKTIIEKLRLSKNLIEDPLFVDPENGNFRLQMKSFGYNENSPLLNAGYPDGSSIGLFLSFKSQK